MISPFQTLSHHKKEIGRFTVIQDRVRVNEHEQMYDYLEIRPGVCILPMKDGKVILQRQYRYPIQGWQWELPGGFVDEGETPQEAAARELKEETGYEAGQLCPLGAFYPSFGSTNEKIYLFFAECRAQSGCHREPGEVIQMQELPKEEFRKLVQSGEFMHGAGLAAWARYLSQDAACRQQKREADDPKDNIEK